MEFTNKVILITGAASGIGKAAALAFASAGAKVVIADRDETKGQATLAEIKEIGAEALFVTTDVTQYAEVNALVDAAVQAFGSIDVAINNAGISGTSAKTAD